MSEEMDDNRGAMRAAWLRAVRAIRAVAVYGVAPSFVAIVLLHFPYDSDADVDPAATGHAATSAKRFYEAAYSQSSSRDRGLDYEQVALAAAKTYDIEGQVRRFVQQHRLERKRVLEVGSGRGSLQDVVDDYTGLDLSPEVARKYHKPFVVGSATDMPFPDSTFDAIWTIWVLEHLPTPERAFEEMRRVVKPGGLLYLAAAWNCDDWLAGGFEVRPYSDFTWVGKVVKASVPLRKSVLFRWTYLLPIRIVRFAHYTAAGDATRLRFRQLTPNYDVYWQADSDAAVSLDEFESAMWFRSRGDACLSCEGTLKEMVALGNALIIKVNK
jgi:SAM-dependent methyltransferase